jgi:hypothetical protein
MSEPLQIIGTEILPPLRAVAAAAGSGTQEQMQVSVEVANPNGEPLHVWSTRRAYDYDASTRTLTLYLTEHTPPLPPGIRMISDHPVTPTLVEVAPNSRGTLEVLVPTTIRRRVPGAGLGMSFVEEPIGQIDQVDLHVQSATEPLQHHGKENPPEHRRRLLTHGDVVRATVTPTGYRSSSEKAR